MYTTCIHEHVQLLHRYNCYVLAQKLHKLSPFAVKAINLTIAFPKCYLVISYTHSLQNVIWFFSHTLYLSHALYFFLLNSLLSKVISDLFNTSPIMHFVIVITGDKLISMGKREHVLLITSIRVLLSGLGT
ncbi:unnamed protein product [Cuscuta europaea]|uniref:Uncharacterized protein n=1 Tax=Cuscuta europaea TaxID=41803 RepID=A0A9P0YWW0_CUSEU|nr:unnamed protein product [Cuscuta europaea]